MLAEITHQTVELVQDQYGNYVVQHVLEHGRPQYRSQILFALRGYLTSLSQHKFARLFGGVRSVLLHSSNVIEKCFQFASPEELEAIVFEMVGDGPGPAPVHVMMKDQFGNYVVQKALDVCTGLQ